MPHRPASRDDDRVAAEMFGMLASNMRSGVPAQVLSLPIFYVALATQGPVPGFLPWLIALFLTAVLYFVWVLPWQRRAVAAARFKALSRALVAFSLVIGALWGLAMWLWFSPDPWRQVVLVVALMAVVVTVCFATASYLASAWAVCVPMGLAFGLRAAGDGHMVGWAMGLTALLVIGIVLFYAHQFNAALLASVRMRFENERLNEALTEQRVQERTRVLEASSRHKSEFLATVSHEIRTPMNAIIGMSGLLMDTELTADQRDFATTIRDSGDTLLTLINDILDFSKIEAGRMDVEQQPFDLRDCVESALDLVAPRAAEKRLDLAYDFDGDVPPAVRGDVTRLRQVLVNLVANAVKFTAAGEVVLTVSAGPGDELQFAVRDTGIGLTPEGMGRLFLSFSQADSSTTRQYGGTGLGLAISKRLVELMGGSMRAESDGPGCGSTFHFHIVAPRAVLPAAPTRREFSQAPAALAGKRLLVVDDNDTNRRLLALQTARWGLLCRDTADPLEALRWLRSGSGSGSGSGAQASRDADRPDGSGQVDLAIVDMHMPGMDGVTLARQMRALAPGLPLVLFSSLGRREAAAEAEGLFAASLSKPLRQSQLFDMLMTVLASEFQPALPAAAPNTPRLDATLAQRHPLRILLAEDNVVNQKLALRLLQQMGYRADVAANGVEAIECVARQAYDLVLMDVQMPEMDGLDATRGILRRWPDAATRPRIVAMTANAMQGDREACLSAGMDDYLTKPIRVDALVLALQQVPARPGASPLTSSAPASSPNA